MRYALVLLAGLILIAPLRASSWADALFDELSKDFGSVPKGPALTHPFRLVNKTKNPVTISNVRVSCGCVTASVMKAHLAPGEETIVHAHMDTRRFSGVKTVTIYVQFSQPSSDEVRLWVQANSRDDVHVSPETFAFGLTKRRSSPAATVTVTFLGGGESRILDIQCDSNYVQTTLAELPRQHGDVQYQLTAQLRSDAPVGKWYTDIWLRTNNTAMPRVRVPLTVEIESALSVSPSTVVLGQVKVGAETERKVIVRGVKPFRITAVRGVDSNLLVRDSTSDSKPVHVLTVTLKGGAAGDVSRTVRIITDLDEEGGIEFQARGLVVP